MTFACISCIHLRRRGRRRSYNISLLRLKRFEMVGRKRQKHYCKSMTFARISCIHLRRRPRRRSYNIILLRLKCFEMVGRKKKECSEEHSF